MNGNNEGDARRSAAGVAFLLGTVMGAAAALLLAPQSGRETRETLRRVGERTRRNLDRLRGKASGAMRRGTAGAEEYPAGSETYPGTSTPGSYKD